MKRLIKVLLVLGIVSIFIGSSWAILSITVLGEQTHTLTFGTLDLTLEEVNSVSISNMVPVTDNTGLTNEAFTFTVENTGDIKTYYQVYLDDVPLEVGQTQLDGTHVRYELKKNGTRDSMNNLMSEFTSIYNGELEVGASDSFELRLWVDHDTGNDEQGKSYSGKLRIVASQNIIHTDERCFAFANGVITGYDASCSSDVIIPETINGEVVTVIGEMAFFEREITSVIISDTVTDIESKAFLGGMNCVTEGNLSALTSVTLGKNVKVIGPESFKCNKLTSVVIPEGTSQIGFSAFAYNELTSVAIPSSVQTISENVFVNNNIESVLLPNSFMDLSGVPKSDLEGLFYENPLCLDVLTNITVNGNNNYDLASACMFVSGA